MLSITFMFSNIEHCIAITKKIDITIPKGANMLEPKETAKFCIRNTPRGNKGFLKDDFIVSIQDTFSPLIKLLANFIIAIDENPKLNIPITENIAFPLPIIVGSAKSTDIIAISPKFLINMLNTDFKNYHIKINISFA